MKRQFLTGFAALTISSVALAQAGDPMQRDPTKPGTMQPGTTPPGTTQPGTMQQGTRQPGTMQQGAMGTQVELAGVVSSVDKATKTLTVVAPLGESEEVAKIGDAFLIDEKHQLVAIDGAYDPKAMITRDGKQVKWSDLKEGDIIRTSFDPNTNMFAGGSVRSKNEVKKEMKKEIESLKKDIKRTDEMVK